MLILDLRVTWRSRLKRCDVGLGRIDWNFGEIRASDVADWESNSGVPLITPVFFPFTLKDVLKRGALVAAANWPVALVQATADSLFKLLIAAPLIGGVFLVALVVGAEPVELMSLEWRQLATTIASTLLIRPAVLAAWLAALAVVLVGGSLFVFSLPGGSSAQAAAR